MDTHGSAARTGADALIALLVGYDRDVARWVGERLGIASFDPCTAIGVCNEDGLIAGVVYNGYREVNIEMTIASSSPRWCMRGILAGLFWYPFEQLGLARVTAIAERSNQPVRAFLGRLGFREEGVMRRAFRNGNDAVIYGMLREECRWIGRK